MTSAQTEARAIAQLFDDIYVRDGFCDWAEVANARDEALRIIATALAAKNAELAAVKASRDGYAKDAAARTTENDRLRAQLAEANKALEAKNEEVRDVLKSVLCHFGTKGANKVTSDALAARRAREQGGE